MYRERINNHRNIVSFVVGDVVMARREVQSNTLINKVGNCAIRYGDLSPL